MPLDNFHATIDGDIVRIHLGGDLRGTGRFANGRIEQYHGAPLGETPEAHESALAHLAALLLEQARAELAAMQKEAYDDDGVDLSLIRWMLSLTPRERLRAVDDHGRSLARVLAG